MLEKRLRIEYYLPFYMLFAQYSVGITTIGDIILIILAIKTIIENRYCIRKSKNNTPYVMLIMYALFRDCVSSVLSANAQDVIIHRMISYTILFCAMFIVSQNILDEEKLYKAWKIAGIIYSAGLIYHIALIYLAGKSVAPINIFPWMELGSFTSRPKSFFIEPSSFANIMTPLLAIALKRDDYKIGLMVTLSIICSTSTTGIIISSVLWIYNILASKQEMSRKITLVFAIIGVLIVASKFMVFNDSIQKLSDAIQGESTFGSRVMCGLEIAKSQSIFELIFGTTYADILSYVSSNIQRFSSDGFIHLYYYGTGKVFSNTFGLVINKYGIVGLILYVLPGIKMLKEKRFQLKNLVVVFLICIFGQGMLFNSYYFTLNILFLLYCNAQEYEENEMLIE